MDVENGVRVLAERPAEDFEPTEEEADGWTGGLSLDWLDTTKFQGGEKPRRHQKIWENLRYHRLFCEFDETSLS